MSNPGKIVADDQVDEAVEDVEIEQGADESGSDEDGADGLGEEPGEGAEHDGEQDDAGADEGQAGQQDQVAAKPRSAATIAVQEAKRAAKEAKAEAEAARRELEQLRQERQGRQTAEQQELERQRIALMDPEEKTTFLLNKQQQEFNGRFGALEFRMQDASDRTAFESLCARNPAFDAVRDDVEKQLGEMRRSGGNATRETVATYFIGKRAIERAAKGGKAKQAAKGAGRVQSQRVAAPAGRSDVVTRSERRGGDEKSARAARLGDNQI